VTEAELADEVCIIDKACRQVGAELAQGGIAALGTHEVAVRALVAKLKRLEVIKAQDNPPVDKSEVPPQ
jgi:hypothetical protein